MLALMFTLGPETGGSVVRKIGGPVMLVHPLALPEADLCRAERPGLRIAAIAWNLTLPVFTLGERR